MFGKKNKIMKQEIERLNERLCKLERKFSSLSSFVEDQFEPTPENFGWGCDLNFFYGGELKTIPLGNCIKKYHIEKNSCSEMHIYVEYEDFPGTYLLIVDKETCNYKRIGITDSKEFEWKETE